MCIRDRISSWEEDMRLMSQGTTALFSNDFATAEASFQAGMNLTVIPEQRDNRGAFALQYALVSVIKGVASLANDQLDECLERLWKADELAALAPQWIGKDVIRGVCTLMGGVIQCMQHAFPKGVWNICSSWKWLRSLQTDALNFQGKEAKVVRSAALFALAVFKLLISVLPPSMMTAASWLSGMEGNRGEALDMLDTCWREDGMLAPWAALVWAAYQLDAKTFLGERRASSDFEQCREIFAWAQDRFPNSIFFRGLEADLAANQRELDRAEQLCEEIEPHIGELRALEWVLNYKKGLYALAGHHWLRAAHCFRDSLQVYIDVGRRSMVPFTALYSALAFLVAGEQHEADSMLDLVAQYKALDKSNWARQDRWAFEMHAEYTAGAQRSALLDLAECMVMRCVCDVSVFVCTIHNEEIIVYNHPPGSTHADLC
eukprot:TRINITY_DN4648_c0_g1_i2.p1 TRINITY_DN4648_c0_g1~~TRINITY_DN4648_c0_g1_i2.p1  ORF type:complete len:432 (+),score=122.71 TRINITY_DN4648_c0_g1_i2:130-1425(+)